MAVYPVIPKYFDDYVRQRAVEEILSESRSLRLVSSRPCTNDRAGRMIQKTWRSHQARIITLQDPEAISAFSHYFFTVFIRKRFVKLRELLCDKPERFRAVAEKINLAVDVAIRIRENGVTLCFPIITSIPSVLDNSQLPVYTLISEESLDQVKGICKHNALYVLQDAVIHHLSNSLNFLYSRNLEKVDLDRYVRLFARTSLFPWDYLPDGCVSRATCVAEWLRLLKVPWNSIKKRFIYCCVFDEFGSLGIDYYHVAIEVILRNKTSLIIDPMVEKEYGLPHDEWIRRLNLKASFYEEDLVDADMLLVLNREKNERQYFKMTPDDMKPINRQLANYRFEHEKDLLSSLKVLSEPQPKSQSPLWEFPSQSQYFGFDDADMTF